MNFIKYTFAYIMLLILWIYIIGIMLSIFGIIDFDRGTPGTSAVIAFICGYIYHKYKPMEFKKAVNLIIKKLHPKN